MRLLVPGWPILRGGTESQRGAHVVLPHPTTNSSLCLHLQGISQAARYVYRRLVNDGILSQAFSIAPVRFQLFLSLAFSAVCSLGR